MPRVRAEGVNERGSCAGNVQRERAEGTGGAGSAQGGWKSDGGRSGAPRVPASPPILPPGKDSLGAPLPPPCSTHPAWSHRGKVMLLRHGKIYPCAEGANNIPYLPTLHSRGLQLQQQQSTFPSMPADFIEQSKAIGRQRLCPGRSPRSWGCRVGEERRRREAAHGCSTAPGCALQ